MDTAGTMSPKDFERTLLEIKQEKAQAEKELLRLKCENVELKVKLRQFQRQSSMQNIRVGGGTFTGNSPGPSAVPPSANTVVPQEAPSEANLQLAKNFSQMVNAAVSGNVDALENASQQASAQQKAMMDEAVSSDIRVTRVVESIEGVSRQLEATRAILAKEVEQTTAEITKRFHQERDNLQNEISELDRARKAQEQERQAWKNDIQQLTSLLANQQPRLAAPQKNAPVADKPPEPLTSSKDSSLLQQLEAKLTELEKTLVRLEMDRDDLKKQLHMEQQHHTADLITLRELQVENSNLREKLSAKQPSSTPPLEQANQKLQTSKEELHTSAPNGAISNISVAASAPNSTTSPSTTTQSPSPIISQQATTQTQTQAPHLSTSQESHQISQPQSQQHQTSTQAQPQAQPQQTQWRASYIIPSGESSSTGDPSPAGWKVYRPGMK